MCTCKAPSIKTNAGSTGASLMSVFSPQLLTVDLSSFILSHNVSGELQLEHFWYLFAAYYLVDIYMLRMLHCIHRQIVCDVVRSVVFCMS
jgi:hypothetical protein